MLTYTFKIKTSSKLIQKIENHLNITRLVYNLSKDVREYASSKTCECGVKNKDLKLSDREWVCSSCGVINQRDLLASQNILKEGRRSLGDIKTNVETEVTRSMKR